MVQEKIFEEIMTGNLPKLVKDINAQNQKVQNPKKEKKGNNS